MLSLNNDVLMFSVQPTCWSHRRRRCQSFCRVRWYRWRWWWGRRETGISHGRDRPQPEPETTSLHAYCEKRVRWDECQRVADRHCRESIHKHRRRNRSERNGRGPRVRSDGTRANDADRRLSGGACCCVRHTISYTHTNVERPPKHVSRRRRRVHERRRSGYRTCEHNIYHESAKCRNIIIIIVFILFFFLYNFLSFFRQSDGTTVFPKPN